MCNLSDMMKDPPRLSLILKQLNIIYYSNLYLLCVISSAFYAFMNSVSLSFMIY